MSNLTHEEQRLLMTLWCMFRSPLMMGGEMRDNDEFTLSLLTNEEVLSLEKTTSGACEIKNENNKIVWKTTDAAGNTYVGLFNATEEETEVSVNLEALGLKGKVKVRDLWAKKDIGEMTETVCAVVPVHGAVLYKLS